MEGCSMVGVAQIAFPILERCGGADPICCSLSPFVEDEIVPLLPQKCVDSFYASLQVGPRPGELGHLPTQKKPKRVIPLHPI